MKEAYCSYEVAELLKKKGFNSPCHTIWYDNRIVLLANLIDNDNLLNTDVYKFCIQKESLITIPTHQMACAWIRDKYGLHIFADYIIKFNVWHRYIRELKTGIQWSIGGFSNPEDAIEEGIKFTIENLIK